MGDSFEREEFQRQFFEAILRSPSADWFDLWGICLLSSWFQSEVATQAQNVLRACSAPPGWLEDVREEAIAIFSGKLCKKRDLGLKMVALGEDFPVLMRTVLRRVCHDSLRRIRKQNGGAQRLTDESDHRASLENFEQYQRLLEVGQAIQSLGHPISSIMRLHAAGYTLVEISIELHRPYEQTCRNYHRGLELVRNCLG